MSEILKKYFKKYFEYLFLCKFILLFSIIIIFSFIVRVMISQYSMFFFIIYKNFN